MVAAEEDDLMSLSLGERALPVPLVLTTMWDDDAAADADVVAVDDDDDEESDLAETRFNFSKNPWRPFRRVLSFFFFFSSPESFRPIGSISNELPLLLLPNDESLVGPEPSSSLAVPGSASLPLRLRRATRRLRESMSGDEASASSLWPLLPFLE